MPQRPRWRPALAACLAATSCAFGALVAADARAQQAVAAAPETPPPPSALDDRLLYQLLVGEMALAQGDVGTAFEWILDAARRTRDETLFRRATDIALQARAGEQALTATRAWRLAQPASAEPLRLQLQILLATNRADQLEEPLRVLLENSPAAERPGLIAALPRFLQRANDPALVARMLETSLAPYRDVAETRVPVRVATGRAWLQAKEPERALALAREAQALKPASPGPALLAMELMRERPAAEELVLAYLRQERPEPALRLAYVRLLTSAQRYADAVAQLELATRAQPDEPGPWLSLGALHLELKHPREGEAALLRYIELVQAAGAATGSAAATPGGAAADAARAATAPGAQGDLEEDPAARPDQGLVQAWLMLAQSAEQRGDFAAAEGWLARIADPQRALEVQTRRASMLARQGRVTQARELIRATPERSDEDVRAKLVAEAGVLREVKRWGDAYQVLAGAVARFPEDTDLLYEQAMMAEKGDRLDEMERLLRRVIEMQPDNAHAHNALGYSLADRGLRLPEARQLIERALELAPGDPFITDSLGWVEFKMGNREAALAHLQRAWSARPDTEIGAHLGEVLWSLGRRDEARRIWREAQGRDAANEVLRETLARLRVSL